MFVRARTISDGLWVKIIEIVFDREIFVSLLLTWLLSNVLVYGIEMLCPKV